METRQRVEVAVEPTVMPLSDLLAKKLGPYASEPERVSTKRETVRLNPKELARARHGAA
jgi:hypothetical protein